MRIGYLTDIHLREAVPGSSPIARRLSRQMTEMVPRCLDRLCEQGVDLVLCTGDLIDDPAHPLALEDLRMVRDMFERCKMPTMLIPGNHDPRPDLFYRIVPEPDRGRKDRGLRISGCEVILFHRDACTEGEEACTRSDDEMAVLEGVCLDAPSGAGMAIIAQHYVVYPDHNEGYPHNYRNDAAIRQLMEQSRRPILSISGHYHPGIPLIEHRGVRYFAGGAFCEAPHPYYVIEIGAGSILSISGQAFLP